MVAERQARCLRASLGEEIERQEREDNARGPEAEPFAGPVAAGVSLLAGAMRRVVARGVGRDIGLVGGRRGPGPEDAVVVTRTLLPVGPGWTLVELVDVPALSVPDGYAVAGLVVGADEIRARHLVVAAQAEFGWGRSA